MAEVWAASFSLRDTLSTLMGQVAPLGLGLRISRWSVVGALSLSTSLLVGLENTLT